MHAPECNHPRERHAPSIQTTSHSTGFWYKCSCGDSGTVRPTVDDALAQWEVHRADASDVWRVHLNLKGTLSRQSVDTLIRRGFGLKVVGQPHVFRVKL